MVGNGVVGVRRKKRPTFCPTKRPTLQNDEARKPIDLLGKHVRMKMSQSASPAPRYQTLICQSPNLGSEGQMKRGEYRLFRKPSEF